MRSKFKILLVSMILGLGLSLGFLPGQTKTLPGKETRSSESLLGGMRWRSIGPAIMGGRIADIAVVESDPHIIYAAAASGGVWKTTNNGVTWNAIFQDQATSCIGDVCVAPSSPDTVWVGTGEPNNRNSSSWGTGVFMSRDGGRSWENKGLNDVHHVGRIVIHPDNPNIVYVAALGHLWGPNKERGLFKTTDGGESWVNTRFIDEDTGFADLAMDPENPGTLYAAAYQRRRRSWGFNGGGPGSGLYKTTDGAKTWVKLSGGLPSGIVGRIGIDIYRRDPNIVYAIVEHKEGGVFRSEDKGESWTRMSDTNPRPMYYSQIRVDPNNDLRVWVLGAFMHVSVDGGKTFRTDTINRIHCDYHAMWIDPKNSEHMILGADGGIHFSYDRGLTWDLVNTIPIGQFYEICVDMRKPYRIYGGMQDNGTWYGPSATYNAIGIINDDWILIGGGDGFDTQIDPSNDNYVYFGGGISGVDLRTGESRSLRPRSDDPGEVWQMDWDAPICISPHDPDVIYCGGNRLFVSMDKGETWEALADLSTGQNRDEIPIMGVLVGEDTPSGHDGLSFYGDVITVTESPVKKGLLYAGTDDGNLQTSRDGGLTWTNLIKNVPGVPQNTLVSRVLASRFAEGAAYVTFDGHRTDDFRAYVYSTSDYGRTWKPISEGLPEGGTVRVIVEHHRNPDLLFVGTERGAFFSLNGGGHWIKFEGNFPTCPVDDIEIHPRENDLILGTHGLSIWILDDITPLELLTNEVLNSRAYLFPIRDAEAFSPFAHRGDRWLGTGGHKIFMGENPPYGAIISYYLKAEAAEIPLLKVFDAAGRKIRQIKGTNRAGINRVSWDLRPESVSGAGTRSRGRSSLVSPGEYRVRLEVGGQTLTASVKVLPDPRTKE